MPQRAALHIAFACSGGVALVYEIVWTRLLTLYIGYTVAAASTVLAAFMGGLAFGAALAGRRASALDRRTAIRLYAALEILVGVSRLLAGRGQFVAAAEPLRAAFQSPHPDMRAMDQLASVFADAGDLPRLASIVKQLEQVAPDSEATVYYSAALQFMSGHADDALHIVSRFPPKTRRRRGPGTVSPRPSRCGADDRVNSDFCAAASPVTSRHPLRTHRSSGSG